MNKLFNFILGLIILVSLTACSTIFGTEQVVVAPHSPSSISSLQMGRKYASEGRYELAKEQFLMALAASDEQNKDIIAKELHAVDMMIKTQR